MNQNLSLRDVSTVLETNLNVVMATNKSVNPVASRLIFTDLMRLTCMQAGLMRSLHEASKVHQVCGVFGRV